MTTEVQPSDHATGKAARRRSRRARMRRIVRWTLLTKLVVVAAVLLAGIGVVLRLMAGPVSLAGYVDGVGPALAGRIGTGWTVVFRDPALQIRSWQPAVRTADLEIRNPNGVPVVRAPLARVTIDPLMLVTGRIVVKAVELQDLQLTAIAGTDGSLSFVPPAEGDRAASSAGPALPPPGAAPEDASPVDPEAPSPVSRAAFSLLEPLLAPTGLVGALDRAAVANARLNVLDKDGRQRVAFGRVNAQFQQVGSGRRTISVELDGPNGPWRFGGTAEDDGQGNRGVDLSASDVPVADALLLTGLAGLPPSTDLKLSAHLRAQLADRRLTLLTGRFSSSSGVIELPNKDLRFLRLDEVAGEASWDEGSRKLTLSDLLWRSGPTRVGLGAELTQGTGPHGWRLAFGGRQAVLDGAEPGDAPVKLDSIAGQVAFDDNGIAIESLSLKGSDVDFRLTGAVDLPDTKTLRVGMETRGSRVRALLRLWPTAINGDLRRYLGQHLLDGAVERAELSAVLSEKDLKLAFSGKPVGEEAMSYSFRLTDAKLVAADGLPPTTRLVAEGKGAGDSVDVSATGGRLELADGRQLGVSEISYRQSEFGSPASTARIGFRLAGPVDAVASLLRAPLFREANTLDLDPALVKGRADLRVALPLQYSRMPKAADLPLTVNGTLTEFGLDRIGGGRERLDNASLVLAYDLGGLSIKGDGRVSGSPAVIDLRQPRGSAGEVVATVTLDDAARQRRSLPASPQLAGAVPVKVAASLAGHGKPTRIEADLSRASVTELLPGWSKAAGRPGRVSFQIGEDGNLLRDFQLESGAVQIRGVVGLAAEGGLERADLSVVRLSVGDDARAQVERAGGVTRINLRGNNFDARPLIRSLTAPPSAAATRTREGDLDLDLAMNILTGNNDEAMTGVSGKVSTRKGDIRQLQFTGKFRGSPVEAELLKREAGSPYLSLRSGDAGATLRFLDVYKRMVGGRLGFTATLGDGVQTGNISIDEFGLRDEPALRRILAQGPPAANGEERGNPAASNRLDASAVGFTKLKAGFSRSGGRTEYQDVAIYGPQVGFTLAGVTDSNRDRMDITGTFIPVYGLNNIVSQVPIVGLILGGGTNEGLFAVDFRISGAMSSPTLTVNPLSAVAPGILRKFLGWALPEVDLPTGATPKR